MVFHMFLAFIIFDPNRPFFDGYSLCLGYSLCKMTDFQNRVTTGIFGVFSSGFLHKTSLTFLQNGFSHIFGIYNF